MFPAEHLQEKVARLSTRAQRSSRVNDSYRKFLTTVI